MLVLNRKERERVLILSPTGEELWVSLVEQHGRISRIGFELPHTYRVIREELLNTPQGETAQLQQAMRERLKARASGSPAPDPGEGLRHDGGTLAKASR